MRKEKYFIHHNYCKCINNYNYSCNFSQLEPQIAKNTSCRKNSYNYNHFTHLQLQSKPPDLRL